ncbi:MAG: hypothetical protein NTZ68_00245 [Candidatus Dependentiae bacterium]|nr:hypothetical protein [Candidatus Dependentiae bacterium]
MKKQILGLLLTFSATCFGSTAEKPSNLENKSIAAPELSQSQQQTELLTEQNKILLALLQLQYNAAVQAEKEKEHKSNRAIQAHKPWINKDPILQAGSQKNAFYDQEENIFYDQTDSFFRHPAVVEKILDALELSIDTFDRYLWPTIRSIIINKIATKITTTAFDKADDIAEDTFGVRPGEFFSSLTPEQLEKNQLLRSPEISKLLAEMKKLQKEVAPGEVLKNLTNQVDELTEIARRQRAERAARADSGIPLSGSNNRRDSTPRPDPRVQEVD